MKLNITIEREDPKNNITGYKTIAKHNPIGWWSVTTEGDCEGRGTRDIGAFYGHVAEIAFSNRQKACYTLGFEPIYDMVDLKFRPDVVVKANNDETEIKVHIRFSYSMLNGTTPNPKAIAVWMDADGIVVSKSNYYDSILLTMKV